MRCVFITPQAAACAAMLAVPTPGAAFFAPVSPLLLGQPMARCMAASSNGWKGGIYAAKLSGARVQPRMMAGFGANKGPPKKSSIGTGLASIRKQEKNFGEMQKEGAEVARLFARAKGEEEWLPVGQASAEAGKMPEAVQGLKRLILSHATELYGALNMTEDVELGYSLGEEGGDVVLCTKAKYTGEKAKYMGEKVGLVLEDTKSGPFYTRSDHMGLRDRIDTTSQASKSDSKRMAK